MADPNTPAWLSTDTPDAPAPATSAPVSSGAPVDSLAQPTASPAAGQGGAVDGEDPPELPNVILFMRLSNMACAIALTTISVLNLFNISKLARAVLSIYAIIASSLICCLETQLKFVRETIAVNFGFLFSSVWRFLFTLLLGSVSFSYGTLAGWIVGGAFVFIAFYNTYVLCRYPSYRKMREKIAEEEDKRIEARISSEVKKQMVNQVMKK